MEPARKPASDGSERALLGSVYRITGEFLARRGLVEKIAPRLSPATRKLLDKPPFPFSWHGSEELEDIERALYILPGGPQLCADLGRAAGEQLSKSVIEPVFRMALSLFGKTPASLFDNLDRLFSMVARGFSFRYEASSPKSGLVTAQIAGSAVHPSLYEQLRGNLSTVFDLCGVQGTVEPGAVLAPGDATAQVRFAVRWE